MDRPLDSCYLHLGDNDETFIKFLLPEFACGIVIGSGGSTVTKMMESSNTVIKFSSGRECYPGTASRVCIITGKIDGISTALQLIFSALTNSTHPRAEEILDSLSNFKMLLSNIASGMVIGKSGSTIKSLKTEFGVKLQVSSKDDNSLPERVLTVSGDKDNVVRVIERILFHTIGDPEAARWKKLTKYNMSPGMKGGASGSSSYPQHHHSMSSSAGIGLTSSASLPPNPQMQAMLAAQTAAALGYGTSAAVTPSNSDSSAQFLAFLQQQAHHQQPNSFMNDKDSSLSSTNLYNQSQMSYAYAQSLSAPSPYYSKYNAVMVDGVNLQVPGAAVSTLEMAIPEVMVMSVASPQIIADVKHSTSVRIEMSGKGEYIPGSYNRKLTIIGPILPVQAAHLIFTQKVIKEQERFRKQGLI